MAAYISTIDDRIIAPKRRYIFKPPWDWCSSCWLPPCWCSLTLLFFVFGTEPLRSLLMRLVIPWTAISAWSYGCTSMQASRARKRAKTGGQNEYRMGSVGYGQNPDTGGINVAQVQTARGLNILVGLWLVTAPWVL